MLQKGADVKHLLKIIIGALCVRTEKKGIFQYCQWRLTMRNGCVNRLNVFRRVIFNESRVYCFVSKFNYDDNKRPHSRTESKDKSATKI